MLSVLALRTGAFGKLGHLANASKILCVASRTQQTSTAVAEKEQVSKKLSNPTDNWTLSTDPTENWAKANEVFYGPDRDLTNFPAVKQPAEHPPRKLVFFPETWFKAFHSKTGVTGPYFFGFGLVTYCMSKEIWVCDHNVSEIIGFSGAMAFITYFYGSKISGWYNRKMDMVDEDSYYKPLAKKTQVCKDKITEVEDHLWRLEGEKHIFEAKKENVDLQLEAQYRERLQRAYEQVRNRMDYQLHVMSSKRSYEHQHMVNWIMENVMKSISPQQEKESIKSCIQTLKTLSA